MIEENREETKPKKIPAMSEELRLQFEKSAQGVASQFSVNLQDVKNAYQDKPETLTTIYNSAKEAKSDRNSYIGWSVFWGIVLWPVALYTGYKAIENIMQLDEIKHQVKDELALNKDKARLSF